MSKQIEALKLAQPEQTVSMTEYKRLQDLVTSQGIRLMEYESKQESVTITRMQRGQEILNWNRSQTEPPITVTRELWVADQLEQFYTSPPASKPLTNAQIGAVAADIWGSVLIAPQSYQAFARAIEAEHGIKGDA